MGSLNLTDAIRIRIASPTAAFSLPALCFLALLAVPDSARANGEPVPTAAPAAPTRFERFVRNTCSPCVQESFTIAPVVVSSVKVPAAALASQPGLDIPPRAGQIVFEVIRASELGRLSHQLLAVRVTILVVLGQGGNLFPVGSGMMDAEDTANLALAVEQFAKGASSPARDPVAGITSNDFQAGSIRVGMLRVANEAMGYVQVGDIALLAQKPVWQVPSSIFISAKEVPLLLPALNETIARLKVLRAS